MAEVTVKVAFDGLAYFTVDHTPGSSMSLVYLDYALDLLWTNPRLLNTDASKWQRDWLHG